jgi:hypothetical protein
VQVEAKRSGGGQTLKFAAVPVTTLQLAVTAAHSGNCSETLLLEFDST